MCIRDSIEMIRMTQLAVISAADDPNWNGPVARHQPTRDSGKLVYADFRAYPSMEAGFCGYAEFLQNPPYKYASRQTSGVEFVRQILADGYCPDSDYLDNIRRIIVAYHLE